MLWTISGLVLAACVGGGGGGSGGTRYVFISGGGGIPVTSGAVGSPSVSQGIRTSTQGSIALSDNRPINDLTLYALTGTSPDDPTYNIQSFTADNGGYIDGVYGRFLITWNAGSDIVSWRYLGIPDDPQFMALARGARSTDRLDVIVYDADGLNSRVETITVAVQGLNDQPVLGDPIGATITDTSTSQPSGVTTGSLRGRFTETDIDTGDTHTFTVDSVGIGGIPGSNVSGFTHRVEKTYGTLHFNMNTGDYEYIRKEGEIDKLAAGVRAADTFEISVIDDSGAGNARSATKTLSFIIIGTGPTPPSDNPATALALDPAARAEITEDEDTTDGILIGKINITDPDGGNFGSLEVAGADAGLFEVRHNPDNNDTELWLAANPVSPLDHETDPSLTVQVRLQGNPAVTTPSFTIMVADGNDRPVLGPVTGASITNIAHPGGSALTGSLTGRFTESDDDTTDTHSFEVAGASAVTGGAITIGSVVYTHSVAGAYGTLYFNDGNHSASAGSHAGRYVYQRDEAEIEKLGTGERQSEIFKVSVSEIRATGSNLESLESVPKNLVFIVGGALPDNTPRVITQVSVNEDTPLEFSQAAGTGLTVTVQGGAAITRVVISVEHGTLSTGGQSINGSETQSVLSPDAGTPGSTRHQLTLSNIDEHDLNALLEGLVYTPNENYNGQDTLTINTHAGGQVIPRTVAIDVMPQDDPLQIMNFGDRKITQDNIANFTFTVSLTPEEITALGGVPTTGYGNVEYVYTSEMRDIDAIDLTPNDNVTIFDPDDPGGAGGYTVAGGKLYFRIGEGLQRNNRLQEFYDPDIDYIKIRESLPAGFTEGVYLDGTEVRYRSAAQAVDHIVASIEKTQTPAANGSKGNHLVEYTIAFHQNTPASFTGNAAAWEAMLKAAFIDLLNIVETDPTHNLDEILLLVDHNAMRTRLVDTEIYTLITAYFEDGASGQVSDQEGVLVVNDQRLNGGETHTETRTAADGSTEIDFEYRNPTNRGNPVVRDMEIIVRDEDIIDAMIFGDPQDADHYRIWTRARTVSPNDDNNPGGPLTLTYGIATTRAEVAATERYFGVDDIDTLHLQADIDALKDAIRSIEEVANIEFREQTVYNPGQADIVFSTTKVEPGLNAVIGYSLSFFSGRSLATALTSSHEYGRTQQVFLHEILHSIGLRHPGLQASGFDPPPYLTSDEAIFENSAMAYTSGLGTDYQGDRYFPIHPQIYDIKALQHLYGVNPGTRDTDTVYDFTSSYDPSTGSGIKKYETIYDMGGVDTFDFNNPDFTGGIELDLTPGARSRIEGDIQTHNWSFVIADGVIIENVIGTKHIDTIRGNDADNTFEGLGGADLLDGRSGSDTASYSLSPRGVNVDLALRQQSTANNGDASGDTLISIESLIGSAHADELKGNNDHNRLEGGGGNDTITGRGGKDFFVVEFGTGKGLDTITDFQRGVDTLVLQVARQQVATALDAFLDTSITSGAQFTISNPNTTTLGLGLAGNTADGVTIQLTQALSGTISSFTAALGGDEHIQIDVV
jgi:VCBS repeat-containing protein